MLCKYIYNTRHGTNGRTYARVELAADAAPPAMPTSGDGIDGLADEILIDDGSRLAILDSGEVHAYAGGTWYKLANADASGVLEVTAPGAYDVSDKAIVIVKEGESA